MASLKIASLLLKTLAKPLAKKIKNSARDHPTFSTQVVIPIAQFLHRNEMKLRINLLGDTETPKIRPLNQAKATERGAEFISETFLFVFAASLISAEAYRSHRKESARRDLVIDRIEALEERAKERDAADEVLRNQTRDLREYLAGLDQVRSNLISME